MSTVHDVNVDEIVDLIRAVDRDRGIDLLVGSLNIAHGIGWLAGSRAMAKVADEIFDRAHLENAMPVGAA